MASKMERGLSGPTWDHGFWNQRESGGKSGNQKPPVFGWLNWLGCGGGGGGGEAGWAGVKPPRSQSSSEAEPGGQVRSDPRADILSLVPHCHHFCRTHVWGTLYASGSLLGDGGGAENM